jgi:hypothetical protein
MNEIKELLESWANEGYPAYDAIVLLVAKIEQLEAQIDNLSNTQP